MKHTIFVLILLLIIYSPLIAQPLQSLDEYEMHTYNLEFAGSLYNYWIRTLDISLAGTYAYSATHEAGLIVIDLSNPEVPMEVACVDSLEWGKTLVSGEFLYYKNWDVFYVFDITTPDSLFLLGSHESEDVILDFALRGNSVILSTRSGLTVLRVPESGIPYETDEYYFEDGFWDVEVYENYAYVCDNNDFKIIDLFNIEEIGSLNYGTNYIKIIDNYMFIKQRTSFAIMYLTAPENPERNGTLSTISYPEGITFSSGHAYAISGYRHLEVAECTDISRPVRINTLQTVRDSRDICSNDSLVIVAGEGLDILDITNPSEPERISQIYDPGKVEGVAVSGDYAFLACGKEGLKVVSIYNRQRPAEVAAVDIDGYLVKIKVIDDIAYAADSSGIWFIDIANPLEPTIIDSFIPEGFFPQFELDGDYLYYVNSIEPCLRIVDISDLSEPAEIGSYHRRRGVRDFLVSENTIYIIADSLDIVDITDPTDPQQIVSYDIEGTNLDKDGNLLCVSDFYSEPGLHHFINILYFLDISNLEDINQISRAIHQAGSTGDMEIVDDYLYITYRGISSPESS